MTDLFFPLDVPIAKVAPRLIDSTGRFTSPLNGAVRTVARPGARWGLRLDFQSLYQRDRARLEAFVAYMRGAENRALISPPDYQQRGSFPSSEQISNNNFQSGTTGWGAGSDASISVNDRVLRVLRTANLGGGAAYAQAPAAASLTQYAPYVWRVLVSAVRGTVNAGATFGGSIYGFTASDLSAVPGFHQVWGISNISGSASVSYADNVGALASVAGEYYDVGWSSLSQCALVDNGGNLLLFSDTFAAPWSGNAASVVPNSATAADGTTTAASIDDTTANTGHYFSQSVAVSGSGSDNMLCGEFQSVSEPFVWLQINENAGPTNVAAWFNLSTGAVGTTTIGSNWTNVRTYIVSLGNGWYYCCLIARKTNAPTAGSAFFGPGPSNGAGSYAGTGGAAIRARRVTFNLSSVPAQQTQTTSAAVAALAQTGSAYRVKGLPASSQGLLLPGDWLEVGKELKRCTARWDSDAAGRGYLQFSPPIRTSANDNDPVIVNMPMGRFLLSAAENGWQTEPGFVSTSSLDFVEAA